MRTREARKTRHARGQLKLRLYSHCDWLLLKCSYLISNTKKRQIQKSVGLGFNGAETNCEIAYILGILLMNSYNTVTFLATTITCSLSTLNCHVSS